MYVVRMKIEKIGSSDSVTYILVHFFVWNDFCTRAPMTVLRMLNGRVFLQAEFRECVPVVDSCRICTRGVILESVLRY